MTKIPDKKLTDNEIMKAFDILDKFEIFGGQRASRELWFNKPADIQNKDIGGFLRDLDFLKQFINRQQAEIERLKGEVDKERRYCNHYVSMIAKSNRKAITGFVTELKEEFSFDEKIPTELLSYLKKRIDYLKKEMVGENDAPI